MTKTPAKTLGEAERPRASAPQKQGKRKERNILKTGVVYIKHIPHGFYEDEMNSFFSQFGKVLRACVARSPKTGNSKGYGYVQFLEEEVAKIAAETMNNYLMFEKIVKCKLLPPEQVTAATFANASRRPGHNCPAQKRADHSVELLSVRKGTVQKRNARRRREAAQRRTVLRLAQLGIKYDLAGGLVQEIEPVLAAPAGDTSADTDATESAVQLPVFEVDESDEEVTFKTPPNVIKRRLSRPAASTPQLAASAPAPARRTPGTPASKPLPKTATPRSAAKLTPKTPKTPITPKSLAKKTPPKSAKQRSEGKKAPKSARKR